jgi:hypothetical protein
MSNAVVSPSVTGVDETPSALRVSFQQAGLQKALPSRFVPQLTLVTGPGAAGAMFAVPCKELIADEMAFQIAMKADGPAAAIRLLSRAQVDIATGRNAQPLFCGCVVKHIHHIMQGRTFDALTSMILDDRWVLSKFKAFGRMEYDPDAGTASGGTYHYFHSAAETIFNHMGFGDCLDTPYGPRFAPSSWFGRSSSFNREVFQEPAPGKATHTPRKWRAQDIAQYWKDFWFPERAAVRPAMPPIDLGLITVPDYITIPKNFTTQFRNPRALVDVDHTDLTALECFQDLARRAGSYDINIKAVGNFRSELQFVDMNPARGTGTVYYLPGYPAATTLNEAMTKPTLIKAGAIIEDATGWYADVALHGDRRAIEQMMSTWFDGTGALLLEPAWSAADEKEYTDYIDSSGPGTPAGSGARFTAANNIWPEVFCAFRQRSGAPIFGASKLANFKNRVKYASFLPTQLTAKNKGNSPQGWEPLPIIFEAHMSKREIDELDPGVSAWFPTAVGVVEFSPDYKVVRFPTMRDLGTTWYSELNPHADDDPPGEIWPVYGFPMRKRGVRINAAIQSDYPVLARSTGDPNRTAFRLAPDVPKYTCRVLSRGLVYVDWGRKVSSRPLGEGRIDLDKAIFDLGSNRAAAGTELYSDLPGSVNAPNATGRMQQHANLKLEDANRIVIGGELVFKGLNPMLLPGLAARIEGDNTIEMWGVNQAVTFDQTTQETIVSFGSHEAGGSMASRPSAPISSMMSGGGGGSPTAGTSTTTTSTIPRLPDQSPQAPGPANGSPGTEDSEKASADFLKQRAAPQLGKLDLTPKEEKKARQDALKKENRGAFAADKAEQRSGKGFIIDRYGNGSNSIMGAEGFGFGVGSSGSINGKTNIMDSFMGKGSSGSINGKTDLNGVVRGMFDTGKADAFDKKNYRSVQSQHNYQIMDIRKKKATDAIVKAQQGNDRNAGVIAQPGSGRSEPGYGAVPAAAVAGRTVNAPRGSTGQSARELATEDE